MIARYVFRHPLVWVDELASILFLWLAMLGSVIALQRAEHMRLTAVVARFSPRGRMRAEALSIGVVVLFLVLMLPSAIDYASDEWFIETPALGLHNTWRAAAIPPPRHSFHVHGRLDGNAKRQALAGRQATGDEDLHRYAPHDLDVIPGRIFRRKG